MDLELFYIDRLPIPDLPLGPPDPVAVITIDGQYSQRTLAIPKSQNPYWNESFDLYDSHLKISWRGTMAWLTQIASTITPASFLYVKVTDQRNRKKTDVGDKGFLGHLDLCIRDLIELKTGEYGIFRPETHLHYLRLTHKTLRNDY